MKTKLNPTIITPEILAIPDTTLTEKLALAIYAEDPKVPDGRLRPALGFSKASLRKLKTKLGAKGLLKGYKVSGFEAQQTAQKVAQPGDQPAPAPEAGSLHVHAELLEIKYLLASEKVVLAFYIAHPSATNVRIFTELGISPAGLKKLKAGLIQKQVLVPIKDGYTVRLPGLVLVRDDQGSHFLSETEALNKGHKVAHPSPKLVPVMDIIRKWQAYDEHLRRRKSTPDSHQRYAEKMAKRIEDESPEGQVRTNALEGFKIYANGCFALEFVRQNASAKVQEQFINQIVSATPEQLSAFREKAEGLALAGIDPQKLLASFRESRQAADGADGSNGSQRSLPGSSTPSEATGAE